MSHECELRVPGDADGSGQPKADLVTCERRSDTPPLLSERRSVLDNSSKPNRPYLSSADVANAHNGPRVVALIDGGIAHARPRA